MCHAFARPLEMKERMVKLVAKQKREQVMMLLESRQQLPYRTANDVERRTPLGRPSAERRGGRDARLAKGS